MAAAAATTAPAPALATLLRRALVLLAAVAVLLAHGLSYQEKVAELNTLSAQGTGAIRLDSKSFMKFVEHPRNYSLIVVFTATDATHPCDICRQFAPEFDVVASSWRAVAEPGRLYLGVLEYSAGSDIFRRLKIETAPQIVHFPPTDGRLGKLKYQKNPLLFEPYDNRGFAAEDFARFVELIVGREIPIQRPFNYAKFGVFLAVLATLALAVRLLYNRVQAFLRRPIVWAILAMGITLTYITGHAYNYIRNVPFAGSRESISPMFQQQYGLETRLMAGLYGTGAISLVLLTLHVPSVKDDTARRALTYTYAAVFMVAAMAIVGVFRYKYPGYPFGLFFT